MVSSESILPMSNRYRVPSSVRARTRFETLATLNIPAASTNFLLAWRPKICALILLVVLGAALYEFFSEGWFFVQQVDVQGQNILNQKQIALASGASGYNIFFLEPMQVERALTKIPEVKLAHVILGVPNSMLVQLQERVPEIVWIKGEDTYWVDADGVAFKARSPRLDLITLRDLTPSSLQAGRRVTPTAFNMLQALRSGWPQAPRNYEWSPINGMSGVDEHGWKIIFGDATDLDLKVIKLKALIARLVAQGARVKFIDVGKGEPFYQ